MVPKNSIGDGAPLVREGIARVFSKGTFRFAARGLVWGEICQVLKNSKKSTPIILEGSFMEKSQYTPVGGWE
jgi:hypothetical protein